MARARGDPNLAEWNARTKRVGQEDSLEEGLSTLMVSRARSRVAHCFGVRFRVSSRTMWSWSPRESNIRIAWGCHEVPHLSAHSCMPLSFSSSSVFRVQMSPLQATLAPPTWLQKDPTYPEHLEFGKLAQLLGSSEDQLGALGRENHSKQRSANPIRKQGAG